MKTKGRSLRGEKHPRHKLKEIEVKEIRRLIEEELETDINISRKFNVSPKQIYNIRNKLRW